MPGFDKEIQRMAQRLLIQVRRMHTHTHTQNIHTHEGMRRVWSFCGGCRLEYTGRLPLCFQGAWMGHKRNEHAVLPLF